MAAAQTSQDETLALLRERAKDGDSFRVKVLRRHSPATVPNHLATLDEATVEHIACPETWIPRLFGDGTYMLMCAHASAPAAPIGGPLSYTYADTGVTGPTRFHLLKSPGWIGPTNLFYPTLEPKSPEPVVYTSVGAQSTPLIPTPPQAQTPVHNPADDLRRELEHTRLALERERAKAEAESRYRDLESRVLQASQQKAPHVEPKTDVTQVVSAIISAAAPIVTAVLQSSQAGREAMLRLEADRAARQDKFNEILLQVVTREPRTDPTVAALVAKVETLASTTNTGAATQLAQMTEAMGGVVQMSLRAVQMAAELQMGPPENPALAAIKEIGKAISSFADRSVRPALPAPAPQPQMNGAPQPQVQETPPNPLDEIESAIRAKAPPPEVAQRILHSLSDPRVRQELSAAGDSFQELFTRRLGGWVMADSSHVEYAKALLEEVNRQAIAAGIAEPIQENQ